MKEQSQNSDSDPCCAPNQLIDALRKVLRPMVRLLLAHNVTLPHLTEILKGVFVEVAEKEFSIPGKKQTDSRISLLTGIHRKDVRVRRHSQPGQQGTPKSVTIAGEIISRWIGAHGYQDKSGNPIPLARLKSANSKLNFEDLVQSVSRQDMRSRAVLDELIRLDVVTVGEGDMIHLNMNAFIPSSNLNDKLHYFGQNIADHIAVASSNLSGENEPLFERSVYYENLSDDSVAILQNLSHKVGMDSLHAVNKLALKLQEQDVGDANAKKRINFGAYFFKEKDSAEGDIHA